jgi:hypothetical protein
MEENGVERERERKMHEGERRIGRRYALIALWIINN